MDKTEIKSLAIGHFDGFHRGHTKLLEKLCKGAILVIENSDKKLTPKRENFTNLAIFYYNLDDIKALSGKDFVLLLYKEFPNLQRLVVGYDFKFGKNRLSSAKDLKALFDGEVIIIDEFIYSGTSVHTSVIKKLFTSGDIKKANELLGRNFEIYGEVIKGQGLGKEKLFATLNLEPDKEQFLPKSGVYASFTKFDFKRYKSVTFIGDRVSTDSKFSIETHILEPFYAEPKNLSVELILYIRENHKFDDLGDLKSQISKDIIRTKEILS